MIKNLTLLFAIAILLPVCVQAQGQLQFNQVRLIDIEGNAPSNTTTFLSQTFEVPEGKVLKVEWAYAVKKASNVDYFTPDNNVRLYVDDFILASGSGPTGSLPMWLPSGTYEAKISAVIGTFAAEVKGRISAIEFNVIE